MEVLILLTIIALLEVVFDAFVKAYYPKDPDSESSWYARKILYLDIIVSVIGIILLPTTQKVILISRMCFRGLLKKSGENKAMRTLIYVVTFALLSFAFYDALITGV